MTVGSESGRLAASDTIDCRPCAKGSRGRCGEIPPRPPVKLGLNFGLGNAAGIEVENSAVGSELGKSGIDIDKATLIDNGVGIGWWAPTGSR